MNAFRVGDIVVVAKGTGMYKSRFLKRTCRVKSIEFIEYAEPAVSPKIYYMLEELPGGDFPVLEYTPSDFIWTEEELVLVNAYPKDIRAAVELPDI